MRKFLEMLGGAALTSLLLCAAIPPGTLGILGWICIVPLLLATRGKGFLFGFFGALLSVFACAAIAESGILFSNQHFGGNDAYLYASCGIYGFSISISCGIWAEPGLATKPGWWFAAIATILESLMLFLLPAQLALTQWRHIGVLQICALGGVWLLSYLIWFANFQICTWISQRNWKSMAILALPVLGVTFFDGLVPETPILKLQSGEEKSVAVMQVGELESDGLKKIHLQASKMRPQLVVWPEFAGIAFTGTGDTSGLISLAKEPGSRPFITTFGDGAQPMPHNTSALFDVSGESQRYFKRKPFGTEKQMYTAGTEAVRVGKPYDVGLNICFDSCFGSVIADTLNSGDISFIALPSIDPDSPHRFMAANHAAHTILRSAEFGIPFAKADGFGYSMITDSFGRIVSLKVQGDGFAVGRIHEPRMTFARKIGDGFLWVCGLLFLWGLFSKQSSSK